MFDLNTLFASALASAFSHGNPANTIPENIGNKAEFSSHMNLLNDATLRRELCPTSALDDAYNTELTALYEWRNTFMRDEPRDLQMLVLTTYYVEKRGHFHWDCIEQGIAEYMQIHGDVCEYVF